MVSGKVWNALGAWLKEQTVEPQLVFLLILGFATFAPAFSRPTHEWQLREVFSEVQGSAFHEAVREISWAMDNGLLLSFKENIGRVPGNHRIIGHGWPLDGSIPQAVLDRLEEVNPGRKQEMMAWWREEAKRLVGRMAEATGLPRRQAGALAGIVWDLHLLGDRMRGNTMVEWVLPPPQIEKNLEDNFAALFRNHPEYAVAVAGALRDALRDGTDEAEQSALLMETLQKAPISEMLLRCWGRTLSQHGITFTENEGDSSRLELFLDMWGSSPTESGHQNGERLLQKKEASQ